MKQKSTRNYSADEIKFIRENYTTCTYAEIADIIGRREVAVALVARRLGLKKHRCPTDNGKKAVSAVTRTEEAKKLADYTPRELMEELFLRGYTGVLTYTETIVHKIDISKMAE